MSSVSRKRCSEADHTSAILAAMLTLATDSNRQESPYDEIKRFENNMDEIARLTRLLSKR